MHSFEQLNILLGTTTSNNTSKTDGKTEGVHTFQSPLQHSEDTAESCKGERSCIKPVVHEHFRKKGYEQKSISEAKGVEKFIDMLASTAKNNSKLSEKPDSASNLPKLSQTAISNPDSTVGVTTSTTKVTE